MKRNFFILLVISLLISVQSMAVTYTWVGTVSGVWSNPLNWSPSSGIPTSTDDVVITVAGNPITFSSNVTIRNFTSSNHSIDLSTYDLNINGLSTISTGSTFIGSGGKITIDNTSDPLGTTSFNLTSANFGQNSTNQVQLIAKSRDILIKSCSFYGAVQFVKTGTVTSQWFGGNTFYSAVDISNTGSGILYLSFNSVNSFQSTFLVNNSNNSSTYVTYANGLNRFVGDATFNNVSGTNQRSYLSVGNFAGQVIFDNNTFFNNNAANALNPIIQIGSLSTMTFGGVTNFAHRGTASILATNFLNSNAVVFNNDLVAQSTFAPTASANWGNCGFFFNGSASKTQASGKKITTSGSDGNVYFSGGLFYLNNFRQSSNSGGQIFKMKGNARVTAYNSKLYGNSDFDAESVDLRNTSLGDASSNVNIYNSTNFLFISYITCTGLSISISNSINSPATTWNAGHVFNGPTTIAGLSSNVLTLGWMPNWNTFYPSTIYNGDVTFICQGNVVIDQNTPSVFKGKVKLNVNRGFMQFGSSYLIAPTTLTSDLEFNSIPTSTSVSTLQIYKANVNGSIYSNNIKNTTLIAYYLNQEATNGQINSITTTGSNIDLRLSRILNSTSFNAPGRTISMSNTLIGSPNSIINFNSGIQTLTSNTINGILNLTSSSQNLTTNTINGALNVTIPATADNSSASWSGGNTFNGPFSFTNYSNYKYVNFSPVGNFPNVFNNDFTLNNLTTNTIPSMFAFSMGTFPAGQLFNGNIIINNTYGNIGLGWTTNGNLILPNGKQLTIGNWLGGNLTIYNTTLLGVNPVNFSLPSNSTLNVNNSFFSSPVNVNAGFYNLNSNIFSGNCSLIRSNYTSNSFSGGNTFRGILNILDASTSTSNLQFGNNARDICMSKVNVRNYGKGSVFMAYNTANNLFYDDINLFYTVSGGGINFCAGGAPVSTVSLLGVNSNIYLKKENALDRNLGNLALNRFFKESTYPMVWGDANDGTFNFTDVLLNGNLTISALGINLADGTFTGVVNFDMNANYGINWNCSKNTVFQNDFICTSNLTGNLTIGVTTNAAKYIFNGNATFVRKSAAWIYLVQNGSTEFHKNLTYISTSNTSFSVGVNSGTAGVVKFLGNEDQYIDFSYKPGTNATSRQFFGIPKMEVNKPSGKLITNSTIGLVAGNLNLANGNIVCQTGTALGVYFEGNSTVNGGGPNSFIEGQVAYYNGSPFTFHVGVGQSYMPLSISSASNQFSYVTVKPYKTGLVDNLSYQGTIKDVIPDQYWEVSNWRTNSALPPANVTLNWNSTNGLPINKNVLAIATQSGTGAWGSVPSVATGDNTSGSVVNTGLFPFSYGTNGVTLNVGFGYLSKLEIDTKNLGLYNYTVSGALESNLPVDYTSGLSGTNNGVVTVHPDFNSDVSLSFNQPAMPAISSIKFNYKNSGVDAASVQYLYSDTYTSLDSRYYKVLNSGNTFQFSNTSPVPDATKGLVAFYPFCGNADDAGPNLLNGTVAGARLTADRFGTPNSAYSFNGINNSIIFSSVPTNKIDDWAISAWINPASLSQSGMAITLGYDDMVNAPICNGYSIGIGDGSGSYYVNGGNLMGLFSNISFYNTNYAFSSTTNWYHIVMQRKSGVLNFYVNGVLLGYSNTTTPYAPTSFTIGSQNGIRYFNGKIDDIKIYNKALSDTEIQTLYNEPAPCINTGLVASYPFCGNADDAGPNLLNGTVTGATLTADRFGNANSAYLFDGLNSIIKVDNFPVFFLNNFSLSVWLKSTGDQGGQTYDSFLAYGSTQANHSMGFAYDRANSNFSYYDITNGSYFFNNGATLPKDAWAHITLIYKDGIAYNYVNGVLKDQRNISNVVLDGDNLLSIGAFIPDNQYFTGAIDDIKIYNRALSPQEVNSLYSESQGLVCGGGIPKFSRIYINTANVATTSYSIIGQLLNDQSVIYQSGLQDSVLSTTRINAQLNSDIILSVSTSGTNLASYLKFTLDGVGNIDQTSVQVLQNGNYKSLAPGYYSITNGNNIAFYKKPRQLYPTLPITTNLVNGLLKPAGQNFIINLPSGLTNPILSIYDKNGNLISSINGLQWDGTSSGSPVTNGTYKYSLTFLDSASSAVSYEGQLIVR